MQHFVAAICTEIYGNISSYATYLFWFHVFRMGCVWGPHPFRASISFGRPGALGITGVTGSTRSTMATRGRRLWSGLCRLDLQDLQSLQDSTRPGLKRTNRRIDRVLFVGCCNLCCYVTWKYMLAKKLLN